MTKAKLLDQPSDYKKIGVRPDKIEVWEDGRRNLDTSPNQWEWWYSDFIFDDGTTAVIQFITKNSKNIRKNGDFPVINFRITRPDGKEYAEMISVNAKDCSYSEKECNVTYGSHFFRGDLHEYHIHVEPVKGYGADLTLVSKSKPYRPGTAYFNFGSEDKYYTWFCTVPKGEVSGVLTFNGETFNVKGSGYHDHQWGSVNYLKEWNHWVWARQSYDDYSILVFDMVATKEHDFERFPIVFIQDKAGNVVFENTHNVTCEVTDYYFDNEASGKEYPKQIHYGFDHNGSHVEYTLKMKKILENTGVRNMSFSKKLAVKMLGLNPSYARYLANGTLSLTDNTREIERSGELIYEFMFPGESCKGHI